jgi:SAM-dependent methyltransferase
MTEFGERYQSMMAPHVDSKAPIAKFFSSVYGKAISDAGKLDATYWKANMENPVLFFTAVSSIISATEGEPDIFLEVGPHSALAGPLRQIFQEKQTTPAPTYVSTLARNENQVNSILSTVGQLFQQGIPIDFAAINGPGEVLTNLPPYPWQHDTSYWKESRVTRNWRLRAFPHHELLGSRILESSDIEPSWRNVLQLENVPWLRDHKIVEDIVFPAAGYIAAVGEAVRQMTGSKDYSLRRLVVKSAFVLQEGQAPELVTSLKLVALTDSLESEWFDFTIASYDGSKWTRHCTGQARGGSNQLETIRSVNVQPRAVHSNVWYPAMKRIGLNYGPHFQCLQDITAHPVHPVASANVQDSPELHESAYAIHPTIIDQTLQLFTVAMSNGLARRLDKLAIPAVIGELYICESGPSLAVEVEARATPKGAIHGSAFATSDGKLVFSLTNSTFNPLETDSSGTKKLDNLAAARLEWKPDINFVSAADLIRSRGNKSEAILLVEKVAVMCMIETSARIASFDIASEHLQKFRSWLNMEVTRMANGSYDWMPDAKVWVTLPSEERRKLLEQARTDASAKDDSKSVASILQLVLNNCDDIFHDRISGVELLLSDNGLASIYTFYQDMVDFGDFFELLGHSQPTMRVLEIGAGTGGTTSWVLKALQSAEGVRLFSKYHYTDISAGFFPTAKEKFKQYTGIEYTVLDISKDVVEQGFEPETYDIVIASNVLHATPSLHSTLTNVRHLLAPGGRLFLQELSPNLRWTNYIMGILPGWWLGEADHRPNEPFVSPARWNEELRVAGFSGVDSVVYDNAEPLQINANIVSTAVTTNIQPEREINLLYHGEIPPMAQELAHQFVQEGYVINWSTLEDEPSIGTIIIILLDLDCPFLFNMSAEKWVAIQKFFSQCSSRSNHVIWVTKSTQVHCSDPSYGLLTGFARTLRSELALDFSTFEVEMFDAEAWKALVNITQGFGQRQKAETLNPEYEYAFFKGKIHTSRFHWISSNDGDESMEVVNTEARLEIGKYGLLGSLAWNNVDAKKALQGDEVEVQIRSVGLNFKVGKSYQSPK